VKRRAASSTKARGATAAKERQRLKDRQHWLIAHEYWARCELGKKESKPEQFAADEVAKRHVLSVSRVRDIAVANHKEVKALAKRVGWDGVMSYCDPVLDRIETIRPPERKSAVSKR
jgi:hypothetical protein